MSADYKPVKYSPLHRVLASLGARFAEVSGWQVAGDFGDPQQEIQSAQSAVGLSDLSFTNKWEMQGADLGQALAAILPGKIPESGWAVRCDGGYIARPSRNHAILNSDHANPVSASEILRQTIDGCVHFVDRTSGFSRLVLCGPAARSVLRMVTSPDIRDSVFPNLYCAWAPMVGIRILLVRRDRKDLPAYEVLVSREYAEYLWGALMEAGQRHQVRPLGLKSMLLLEAS